MTERSATIEDGRYQEKLRRAAEMQLLWAAEDAANVIDLDALEQTTAVPHA